jgi:tetratricopeptide (TPR) repeat protein
VRASIRLAQHLLGHGLRQEATTLLRSADEAARRAGLVRLEEQCCSTLGFALVLAGQAEDARAPLKRALALAQEHGARRALFVARVNLGLAHALAGDPAAGRRELAAGLELSRRPGWFRAVGLAYRALAELLDDAPEAGATARIAATLAAEQAHPDAAALAEALRQVDRAASGHEPGEAFRGGAEIEAMRRGLQAWRAR